MKKPKPYKFPRGHTMHVKFAGGGWMKLDMTKFMITRFEIERRPEPVPILPHPKPKARKKKT